MSRHQHRLAGAATLLIVMATLTQAPAVLAGGRAQWIDVLSVEVEANGLIVIVCRGLGDVLAADGTHQGPGAGAVFKDGTIVSVTGRHSFGVEEVTIGDEGEIILLSSETAADKASPYILPNGEFLLDGRPGRDRTRKPLVTGFRIHNGAIVSAQVDRP